MLKCAASELALWGGPPAFPEPLHVGRPNLGDRARLLARIEGILDRRWFTNGGPLVQELESRIAEIVGTRHAIAMANGTIALEIAIRASGLAGEVIVPAMTFVATAHALEWQGLRPVFCDVEPQGFTLDPAQLERHITPRTSGIIGVHLWGRPCAVERLTDIARSHGLKLLFDAAHAFGCSWNGRRIGSFGDAEVFSFHATKFINSFEGGAVTTDDDELAARMRLMKNFGFGGLDRVVHVGTNGKMCEVAAAMGLTSLDALEQILAWNRCNYERYRAALGGIPGLELVEYDATERHNYQYIVVRVDPARSGLERDELVQVLHAEGVLARRYFYPGVHRMEPYASRLPPAARQLPVTEEVLCRVIALPTGTAVGGPEIDAVCAVIRLAVAHAAAVRACLAARGRAAVAV